MDPSPFGSTISIWTPSPANWASCSTLWRVYDPVCMRRAACDAKGIRSTSAMTALQMPLSCGGSKSCTVRNRDRVPSAPDPAHIARDCISKILIRFRMSSTR